MEYNFNNWNVELIQEPNLLLNKLKEFNLKGRTIRDVNFVVNGRGGTAFTPVIEYINESGKYKDAVLIYFTDGQGEFEIPKPKTYRNLWVVFDDSDYLTVREPYGEVIELKRD